MDDPVAPLAYFAVQGEFTGTLDLEGEDFPGVSKRTILWQRVVPGATQRLSRLKVATLSGHPSAGLETPLTGRPEAYPNV